MHNIIGVPVQCALAMIKTVIEPDDDYYIEILQRQRTEDLVDLFQLIQFQFAAYCGGK